MMARMVIVVISAFVMVVLAFLTSPERYVLHSKPINEKKPHGSIAKECVVHVEPSLESIFSAPPVARPPDVVLDPRRRHRVIEDAGKARGAQTEKAHHDRTPNEKDHDEDGPLDLDIMFQAEERHSDRDQEEEVVDPAVRSSAWLRSTRR